MIHHSKTVATSTVLVISTMFLWAVLFATLPFVVAARTTYSKNDRITIATVDDLADSIDFGDLNGDGNLDLVVGIKGAVYWVPSKGAGLFDAPKVLIKNEDRIINQADGSSSAFYAEHVRSIQVADVNGDGSLDIVAGCTISRHSIFILVNNGSGSFTAQTILPGKERIQGPTKAIWNIYTHDIKVADFKGTGVNDVIATVTSWSGSEPEEYGAGMLLYIENDGSGVFSKLRVLSEDTQEFAELATSDYDDDGSIDIAVLSTGRSILWLYQNDGSGNFVGQVIDVSAVSNNAIAAGDLDNDGDVDIACLGRETLTIYWNLGQGSFQEDILFDCYDAICTGQNIVVFDADNDGQNDIIAGPRFGQSYADTWFHQTRPGEFVGPEMFTGEVNLSLPTFADVNGDGIYDYVVGRSNNVYAFLGTKSSNSSPEKGDDKDTPTESIFSVTTSGDYSEEYHDGATKPFRGSFAPLVTLLAVNLFLLC